MAIQNNKIEKAIMEFPNGAKIDFARYINLPIAWEDTLDETLGTAKMLMTDMRQADFTAYGIRIDKPFSVNVPIEIAFVGQSTKIRMIVARDTAEMVRKDTYATWSHNVEFVDEVKRLEQEPVDNLAFKNPVARSYDYDGNAIWTKSTNFSNNWEAPTIKQAQKNNSVTLSFNQSSFFPIYWEGLASFFLSKIQATVTNPTGEKIVYSADIEQDGYTSNAKYKDTNFTIDLGVEGEYEISFTLDFYGFTPNATTNYTHTSFAYFCAIRETDALAPYTLQKVINRVLDLTPTRTKNGSNKYTFANNAEEYANEESPEFTFTGKHLFEVMLDIANYKRQFPALRKNEIYFRPFWNGKMLTSDKLPPPDKAIINSAVDQYCTALDSYVENMVCINDTNVGTVVEPYRGGYISARSSGGSEISETTAIIPTLSTIYQPLAVDVRANEQAVGDIISYVYEREDYESLSDTTSAYPYSKAYALRYDRFKNNIAELGHRIKSSSTIADAMTKPAFANITYCVAGVETGAGLHTWLSAFVTDSAQASQFANCLFQPTYIPVVNARVRQYKPLVNEDDYDATIFYNQQAEVVDSEAFGEHVKNMVQKLGNHTEIRVYRFAKIDDVPTCGTIIDGKSVYNVATTIYENHVGATLCLVDYAELSNYIGVKNEIKTSDISISKWNTRHINFEEFFVFTHEDIKGTALSITGNALAQIGKFVNSEPLTCAMFSTYRDTGAKITTAFAPIKHLAIGNSIYFQFEMLDNFAVGYKSNQAPTGATNAITGTRYDRAQTAVRYCDTLGRCETMEIMLLPTGPTAENKLWGVIPDKTLVTNDDLLSVAHAYPSVGTKYDFTPCLEHRVEDARPVFNLLCESGNELLVKKDSAEALKIALQYHFRQTWKDFIIGSGMANFCPLVGGKCYGIALFVSRNYINRYDRRKKMVESDVESLTNPTFDADETRGRVVITLPDIINTTYEDGAPVLSWGLYGKSTEDGDWQLIFGENRSNNMPFETTIYLVGMAKNNK